jgi:2,3-bisphosphoglycerate-independent phosphoglycerate mutase
MKVVYVVLDGAAGSIQEKETAYLIANTPGLDMIANKGRNGCFYPIGEGKAPESDVAVMSILGYPEHLYPGRGPIEALGIGYELIEGREVVFRGNLATVDLSTRRIIDRRVGRNLSDEEAKKLMEPISFMLLDNGNAYARVFHTVGYRAVVVLGSYTKKLSPRVSNVDPAYRREGLFSVALDKYSPYVSGCEPLEDSSEARYTCELVNEFLEKSSKILESHEINKKREAEGKLKANFILLRDAGGSKPSFPSFVNKHGLRGASIVDMPVEIGISRACGLEAYVLSPSNPPTEQALAERLDLTLRLIDKYDFVYIHIKGPDEPGHDGDCAKKARIIEKIDEMYLQPLLMHASGGEIAVVVLSDHATPCSAKSHTADPVPIGIYHKDLNGDMLGKFGENSCCKGSLGLIPHGTLLIETIKKVITG